MFDKNDKTLLTVRILTYVIIAIEGVTAVITSIVLAATTSLSYLWIAVAGAFGCWVEWLLANLLFSFLCDVKLIRNKLYGIDNSPLEVFLSNNRNIKNSDNSNNSDNSKTEEHKDSDTANTPAKVQRELANLERLLKAGVITEEEFNNRINAIFNKNSRV